MAKYFGTDGIRGKANDFLSPDLAMKVGKSLEVFGVTKVIIGWDTRVSSPMIVQSLTSGALSCTMDVIQIGVVPTPCICYLSSKYQCLGIMITASHNPYQDNGIKLFNQGLKFNREEEKKLEERIDHPLVFPFNVGKFVFDQFLVQEYCQFVDSLGKNNDLKIGIDAANGATYQLVTQLFPKAQVIATNPNGININHLVGATHVESILNLVKKEQLAIGFAIDGDGDRLVVVDQYGTVYDGDQIIFILAVYYKNKNKLNHNTVVLTKMSNLAIIHQLELMGIRVVLTDVGDKYVLEEILGSDYSLGGESSGHIILGSILPTGDALVAIKVLLNIIQETGKSLQELTSLVTLYPTCLLNLKVIDKKVVQEERVLQKVKKLSMSLGKKGKILVRASGTENVIRIYVCAKEEKEVKRVISEMETFLLLLE